MPSHQPVVDLVVAAVVVKLVVL